MYKIKRITLITLIVEVYLNNLRFATEKNRMKTNLKIYVFVINI
jgi:hypothetical protein